MQTFAKNENEAKVKAYEKFGREIKFLEIKLKK